MNRSAITRDGSREAAMKSTPKAEVPVPVLEGPQGSGMLGRVSVVLAAGPLLGCCLAFPAARMEPLLAIGLVLAGMALPLLGAPLGIADLVRRGGKSTAGEAGLVLNGLWLVLFVILFLL